MRDDQRHYDQGQDRRRCAPQCGYGDTGHFWQLRLARLQEEVRPPVWQRRCRHAARHDDQRDEQAEVRDDVREVDEGSQDGESDANHDGDDDGVDRYCVALADLGQPDRKQAVECKREHDARDHGDEGQVDRELRGRHRDADQDLADRVARQDEPVAQPARRRLQAGDGAVGGGVACAELGLRLHEIEADRASH